MVVELNPTYNNLVGRIEKELQMGALNTDFTLIKPGALLQANGGFLVLPVEDVLRNVYSWDALKRALRSGDLRIEEGQEQLGLMSIKTLRPQPIPLDLEVILVGKPLIYYLLQKYDDDFQELIDDGTLLIDTAAARVGQVNGLSVVSLGDYTFGRPNRITATPAPGRAGVVDIEREAKLGGPVHSKGVLILTGYLSHAFSRNDALSLSGRVVFEQSYQGVDGDSASSAELYALFSVLAGVPVSQSIAVTGSVNQYGEIQAVGGINEKIEGFFDVCSLRGLDGTQGVMIPAANVQNLMLREDVVDAIASGTFAVWAVSTVAEGIERLTGTTAGDGDLTCPRSVSNLNAR